MGFISACLHLQSTLKELDYTTTKTDIVNNTANYCFSCKRCWFGNMYFWTKNMYSCRHQKNVISACDQTNHLACPRNSRLNTCICAYWHICIYAFVGMNVCTHRHIYSHTYDFIYDYDVEYDTGTPYMSVQHLLLINPWGFFLHTHV